jgi:hypothetical protein
MEIPLLVSRFPTIVHPQIGDIVDDAKKFVKTDAFKILNKNTAQYGDYIGTGAVLCSYIYPLGDTEKVKAVSRFFCYWTLADDVYFDNSIDLDNIYQMIDRFRAAVEEQSNGEELFAPVIEFCSRTDWKKETKSVFRNEMNKYLESVKSLRTAEVQKRLLGVEEYLSYRKFDVAMQVALALLWYTLDDTQLSTFYNAEFTKIFEYSSLSIGILLDLYTLNARKAEIKNYTQFLRIIRSIENCDEAEAINKSVQLFYKYEAKMLETKYPKEILHFKYAQSGTVRYCAEGRKMRYMQHADADENLVNGMTIV